MGHETDLKLHPYFTATSSATSSDTSSDTSSKLRPQWEAIETGWEEDPASLGGGDPLPPCPPLTETESRLHAAITTLAAPVLPTDLGDLAAALGEPGSRFSLAVEHGLSMRGRLNRVQVLELFYPSLEIRHRASKEGEVVPRGRFRRARGGAYLGLSYQEECELDSSYWFGHIADPMVGSAPDGSGAAAAERLRQALQGVKKIAPRASFLLLTGRIAAVLPGEPGYEAEMALCHEILETEVSPAIPILFAGEIAPGRESRDAYRKWCGDPQYTAWCGGTMIIVPNALHLASPAESAEPAEEEVPEAKEAAQWLRDELFRGKCCAKRVMLASPRPFYTPSKGEAARIAAKNTRREPELLPEEDSMFDDVADDVEGGEEMTIGEAAAAGAVRAGRDLVDPTDSPMDQLDEEERMSKEERDARDARLSPRALCMRGIMEATVGHGWTGSGTAVGRRDVIPMPKTMYGQMDLESVQGAALGADPREEEPGRKLLANEGAGVRVVRVFEQGVVHHFHRIAELPTSARLLECDYDGP